MHLGARELTRGKMSGRRLDTPVLLFSTSLEIPKKKVAGFSSFPVARSDSLETHKYFFVIFIITARSSICFKITSERATCNMSYQHYYGKKCCFSFLPRNGKGVSVRAEARPQVIQLFSLVLNTRTNQVSAFPTPSSPLSMDEEMETFLLKNGETSSRP